jgi:hypothetical protein
MALKILTPLFLEFLPFIYKTLQAIATSNVQRYFITESSPIELWPVYFPIIRKHNTFHFIAYPHHLPRPRAMAPPSPLSTKSYLWLLKLTDRYEPKEKVCQVRIHTALQPLAGHPVLQ